MRNLTIDIGNTNSKVAVFEDREMRFHEVFPSIDEALLKSLIAEYDVDCAILSNVNHAQDGLITFLQANTRYIPFSVEKNT